MDCHTLYSVPFGECFLMSLDKLKDIIDEKKTVGKLKNLLRETAPKFMNVLNEVLGDLLPDEIAGIEMPKGQQAVDPKALEGILKGFQDQMQIQQNELVSLKVVLKELAKQRGLINESPEPTPNQD